MVADGRFRDDLYYRINVLSIDVPPLRERREDIPVLIDYFLKKHTQNTTRLVNGLTPETKKLMNDYSWPGNVRQLESAIERAILLSEGDLITAEDLPTEVRQEVGPAAEGAFKLPAEGINFEDVERNLITQAMEQTDYNITKAAKLLGLTFRTLQYRLEKFGIKKPDGKDRGRGRITKSEVSSDSLKEAACQKPFGPVLTATKKSKASSKSAGTASAITGVVPLNFSDLEIHYRAEKETTQRHQQYDKYSGPAKTSSRTKAEEVSFRPEFGRTRRLGGVVNIWSNSSGDVLLPRVRSRRVVHANNQLMMMVSEIRGYAIFRI